MRNEKSHVARVLSVFKPHPERAQFAAILNIVSNGPASRYFPELFVLAEHLHGPYGSDATGCEPWVALETTEAAWLAARAAYATNGIVGYVTKLREEGYTNDELCE